ncbi:hypothetical protein ACQCVH_22055 [Bacillus infantis]|uniref:hypothetical protein n=1 Tax=Bacillus infantis TaxID=324767 RepID=UPI003CEEA652
MLSSPPLVIDTGIVSRYGFTNRFDILEQLFGGDIIIPNDVLTECWQVPKMQTPLDVALKAGWLNQFTIDFVNHVEIISTFGALTRQFGPGESAVLSIAKVNGYSVGCDDMRAAARFCKRNSIPLLGSIGVLYQAFDKGIITHSEADLIHNDMINLSKYRSPISSFQQAIDWFKDRQGRELF